VNRYAVVVVPVDQGKRWWAMLVSNQWPLPCEGNTATSGHIRLLLDRPENPGIPGF